MSTNCTYCNSSNNIIYYPITNSTCTTGNSTCSVQVDASCAYYTGANLTSIGVDANTTLQDALTAINTTISEITGINWDEFDYSCLDDVTPITTAEGFAEAVSAYVCTLNTTVDTFIDTTYATDKTTIEASITAIDEPELSSCTAIGVVDTDTIKQVLTKILTNLCNVNTAIDPSSANWNAFSVVSPLPDTIIEAFNMVIAWVDDLYSNPPEAELPQFDTRNTCLSDPQEADTLYDTVVKIIEKLCELPEFDIDELIWQACIANPNEGGGADLISTFNLILQRLNSVYSNRVVTYDSDYFETSYVTVDDACSGLVLTIKDGVGLSDKLVALDSGDADPDYLLNKITAGTNITFDTSTAPGTVIIDCDATDVLVKADAADTTADYLINKINGKSDGDLALTLTESYNGTTDKVDITPSFDWDKVTELVLTALAANNTNLTTFNGLVCAAQPCPDGETKTITFKVTTVTGSIDTEYSIVGSQLNPTLAMYSSGNIVATSGDVFTSGAYTVTSANIPVTGVLTLNNNNAGAELPYNIYVEDENGDPVTGSTEQTGSIPASDTLTINPFTYGSVTHMVVNIELGSALTTTTSTTTTTTTL